MSRKFKAVNRITGEEWKPSGNYKRTYLVMYDSGYLAVVKEDGWGGTFISPLDPKEWMVVHQQKNSGES